MPRTAALRCARGRSLLVFVAKKQRVPLVSWEVWGGRHARPRHRATTTDQHLQINHIAGLSLRPPTVEMTLPGVMNWRSPVRQSSGQPTASNQSIPGPPGLHLGLQIPGPPGLRLGLQGPAAETDTAVLDGDEAENVPGQRGRKLDRRNRERNKNRN